MIRARPLLLLSRYWIHETQSTMVLGAGLIAHLLWGIPTTPLLVFMLILRAIASRQGRPGLWPGRWLRRLTRRVGLFRTHRAGRVSVHYPPELDGRVDLGSLARLALDERADLARWFGVRPRRRLQLVLYPDCDALSKDFGRPIGGTVLAWSNAVVLASDNLSREVMRHELVHLFAHRWNASPPPLFQEGLAVWLDEIERHPSPGAGWPDLAQLLDDGLFFEEYRVQGSYALAGAFTGFLIRRFGRDRYRAFYRKADRSNFRTAFDKRFGMSLDEAWLRCRDETLAMASLERNRREDGLFRMEL